MPSPELPGHPRRLPCHAPISLQPAKALTVNRSSGYQLMTGNKLLSQSMEHGTEVGGKCQPQVNVH